jgi:hypothetical protein
MANHEQYEIWVDNHGKWERVAFFTHFDVASAVFSTRSYRQRLIHATYDDNGKKVSEETLAEIGRTREDDAPAQMKPVSAEPGKRRKAS